MKNKVSQKNGERYRSFFENAAVVVAVVGLDGKVLEANEADCRFLGPHSLGLMGMREGPCFLEAR